MPIYRTDFRGLTARLFNFAFIVTLAGTPMPVINHLVEQHGAELLRGLAGLVRHDPGNLVQYYPASDISRTS